MLISILLIPIIGCIIISPISSSINFINIKQIALYSTIINFIISIIIYIIFNNNITEYQFINSIGNSFYIGIDGISIYFVILTTFIIPIAIVSNWDNIDNNNIKYYIIFIIVLESLLIGTFVVIDILQFYILFESVLIPLFFIIGIWGGSSIRVRAAFLLFLYTLFGSLFILVAFIIIYNNIGSTDIIIIKINDINIESQYIIFILIFISIAVKTPLIPFHIWLPRAHAEAPLAGSIILAGLILKLATYGYIRIIITIIPDATNYYTPIVFTISIITLIYTSIITFRQIDFKAIVAYSSISHIAIVVIGLFSNTIQSIEGAIIITIAHGVVSPGLFILVGGVLYDRYHTRIIQYYRGITNYIPQFSILFFIFTIFNAAVPLSGNFIGEFICLTGIYQRNPIICGITSIGIVLSAAYSIWLYNRIVFGIWSKYIKFTIDINRREFILIIPLLFISIILGIYPNIVLDSIHSSTTTLIYNITTTTSLLSLDRYSAYNKSYNNCCYKSSGRFIR